MKSDLKELLNNTENRTQYNTLKARYNMSKTDQDKSYFLAFCIEQYKVAKGMNGADVARLFFGSGVASYLSDNFEVLHTQSRQWLMEEIDDMLQQIKQKGK